MPTVGQIKTNGKDYIHDEKTGLEFTECTKLRNQIYPNTVLRKEHILEVNVHQIYN